MHDRRDSQNTHRHQNAATGSNKPTGTVRLGDVRVSVSAVVHRLQNLLSASLKQSLETVFRRTACGIADADGDRAFCALASPARTQHAGGDDRNSDLGHVTITVQPARRDVAHREPDIYSPLGCASSSLHFAFDGSHA